MRKWLLFHFDFHEVPLKFAAFSFFSNPDKKRLILLFWNLTPHWFEFNSSLQDCIGFNKIPSYLPSLWSYTSVLFPVAGVH